MLITLSATSSVCFADKIFANWLLVMTHNAFSIALTTSCQPGGVTHVRNRCKLVKRSHRKHVYIDVYYPAKLGSLCSCAAETFNT